jgi:hypothetical protein
LFTSWLIYQIDILFLIILYFSKLLPFKKPPQQEAEVLAMAGSPYWTASELFRGKEI